MNLGKEGEVVMRKAWRYKPWCANGGGRRDDMREGRREAAGGVKAVVAVAGI